MAYIRGTAKQSTVLAQIIQKLTSPPPGSTVPLWEQVQSGTVANDGYVLSSKGSSGTDRILIRFKPDTGTDLSRCYYSIMEGYTPNQTMGLAGVADNESPMGHLAWANATAGMTADTPVSYILSFDKDKIIAIVWADRTVPGWIRSVLWAGMPDRVGQERDSTAVTAGSSTFGYWVLAGQAASSEQATYGQMKTLRKIDRTAQPRYALNTIEKFRSKGWGDKVLLPYFYGVFDTVEGPRYRLTSIHPVMQPTAGTGQDFRDMEEVSIGSKKYLIVQGFVPSRLSNLNCFTSTWLAIEKLE